MYLCPCCVFAESASNIEGLQNFSKRTLPSWFRERLLELGDPDFPDKVSDEDLVESELSEFGEFGLMAWGSAEFKGEEVVVVAADAVFDYFAIAAQFGCGLVLVEPSGDFADPELTVILSEHPVRRARTSECP